MNELCIKQLNIYESIADILKIFADSEIGGQYELNNDVICDYINGKAFVDFFECTTKEEIYERFTKDVINGYPIWQMLKLSEWTRKMVETSFAKECEEERLKAEKLYKCFTCKWFVQENTWFGLWQNCKVHSDKSGRFDRLSLRERSGPFKVKKICKYYERKE